MTMRSLMRSLSRASLAASSAGQGDLYPYANTEARTLVAAMTVQPGAARKAQIDALITTLKAGGLWTKLDVLWLTAAHATQAKNLNWKSPSTFTLTETGTVAFTVDRGCAGNGVDSFLPTGWDPATNGSQYTQDSATLFLWSRTAGLTGLSTLGSATTAVAILSPRNGAGNFVYRVNQAAGVTTANADGSGLIAASRTAAAVTQGYRNGATLGAAGNAASTALTTDDFAIGKVNNTFSAVEIACAGMGAGLNDTEHTALYNALSAYMTAVGAA